ncbi:LptF/LptG family permease [Arundinibacter roseus]|uniref:YjgP/YjgQ family permease n=1 Tax=Arundinibacter roseus TaxID=2070510 RepID=A0A4R4KJC7_9BACT|nr:LptF/LptG family permease [Arundinibacter roseus]TDB66966.1 YjgP/YjgQ family permease [Arundinibacter roseus]
MKKLDKLVLKSFWGPFIITLSVVVFIFLMRIMIAYIDHFVSKDVGITDYARLFFFFALSTVPIALPLAMLLSSLMAFGNLGEFFELTALKSAGVSVIRIMMPLFVVAVLISIFSFFFNDRVVPWANLKGYTILWDIKTSKATMKIKEGIFYNDLPGYSIKVDKKLDAVRMKGMIIYKHDVNYNNSGNNQVILADSGKIYTINDDSYLVIELFSGNNYQEVQNATNTRSVAYSTSSSASNGMGNANFMQNRFDSYKLVVSMESFGMKRTDEEMFKYHQFMKNIEDLTLTTDSLRKDFERTQKNLIPNSQQYFSYKFRVGTDYVAKLKQGPWVDSLLAKPLSDSVRAVLVTNAQSAANSVRSFAQSNAEYLTNKRKEGNAYELEKLHKYTQAFSCLVMLLIGAPLGAIIKKGGFGVPVLISIIFFILMYVMTIQADKYVKDDQIDVTLGAWIANSVLLAIGLYFIEKARNDSRIFEKDVYQMYFAKMKARIIHRFSAKSEPLAS